jgi:beta-galactosidase/beta-glucuronidase
MMQAMIRRSINHPSIIIWGFLNEAATDHHACRPFIEETVRDLRTMDSSRRRWGWCRRLRRSPPSYGNSGASCRLLACRRRPPAC